MTYPLFLNPGVTQPARILRKRPRTGYHHVSSNHYRLPLTCQTSSKSRPHQPVLPSTPSSPPQPAPQPPPPTTTIPTAPTLIKPKEETPESKFIQQFIHAIETLFHTNDSTPTETTQSYQTHLQSFLHPTAIWELPFTSFETPEDITENLLSFLKFLNTPTIDFISTNPTDSTKNTWQIHWIFSATWPVLWGPRVAFSATTHLTLSSSSPPPTQNLKITYLHDKYDHHPLAILSQIFPQFSDIWWLYASPHAETTAHVNKVLCNKGKYLIRKDRMGLEYVYRRRLIKEERKTIYVVPFVPEEMFSGDVRRKEAYSTVSPFSIRSIDNEDIEDGVVGDSKVVEDVGRNGNGKGNEMDKGKDRDEEGLLMEWSVPIPGKFIGTGFHEFQGSNNKGEVRRRAGKTYAVVRWRGKVFEKQFLKKVEEIQSWLIRDGFLQEGEQISRSKIRYSYLYSKAGFNGRGQLAIAAYFVLPFIDPVYEIAVELPPSSALKEVEKED